LPAEARPRHDAPVMNLSDLVVRHGYWIVAAAIGIESMGIPVPGETMLVAAAIYAGATHKLDIGMVIAAAVAGAIIGDGLGFLIGRRFGHRLLLRYGSRIGRRGNRFERCTAPVPQVQADCAGLQNRRQRLR